MKVRKGEKNDRVGGCLPRSRTAAIRAEKLAVVSEIVTFELII